MEFFDVIARRASVRSFEPCDVPERDLMRILDAGRRAPSGYNRQPWEFILVTSSDALAQLGKIQGCIGEASAPRYSRFSAFRRAHSPASIATSNASSSGVSQAGFSGPGSTVCRDRSGTASGSVARSCGRR